jgi:hypothetical protein
VLTGSSGAASSSPMVKNEIKPSNSKSCGSTGRDRSLAVHGWREFGGFRIAHSSRQTFPQMAVTPVFFMSLARRTVDAPSHIV